MCNSSKCLPCWDPLFWWYLLFWDTIVFIIALHILTQSPPMIDVCPKSRNGLFPYWFFNNENKCVTYSPYLFPYPLQGNFKGCAGTMVGQELYKLLLLDTISQVGWSHASHSLSLFIHPLGEHSHFCTSSWHCLPTFRNTLGKLCNVDSRLLSQY